MIAPRDEPHMNHLDTGEQGLVCCWLGVAVLIVVGVVIAALLFRAITG